MSGERPLPRAELADLCRQARALADRVLLSRWPGIEEFPCDAAPVAPPAVAAAGRAAADPAPGAWDSLESITEAIGRCAKCALHATRTNTVPGEGPPRADLMFVGEAPGADEDRQGRPFVGRAGQLLTKMIAAMGFSRGEVFIANVLKCRPPGNRDPLPEEAAACLPYLRGQLALVRPKVICALGKHAAQALLGTKDPIGRLRGRFHDCGGTPLMATFHPSYLLRNEADRRLAWQDLKLILGLLGRPVPPAPGRGAAP